MTLKYVKKYNVQCDYVVSVGQCETPDAPLSGSVQCEDVTGLFSKRCKVTCEAGKTFLRPVPKFYSCGLIGVWNTASPMLKFRFPPCGGRSSFEILYSQ